jgi:ribosomal protein S13
MPKKSLTEEQKKQIADNCQNTSAADLAKPLYGIGEKTVQKYINTLEVKTDPAVQTTSEPEPKTTQQRVKTSIQAIHPEGKVTQKGGVVMTAGNSKIVDEVTKGSKASIGSDVATKIYPNEPLPPGVRIEPTE